MTATKPASKGRTKASQERGWANIMSRISKLTSERPDDQIASLIAELRGIELGRKAPGDFYLTRPLVEYFGRNIMAAYEEKLENPFLFPEVTNREYGIGNLDPIRYLQSRVKRETTCIVELGSGWSANLFQLYIALGRSRSSNLTYIGAEYTDQGRECARAIANFDDNIDYEDYEFDYRSPDISFLDRFEGHILVFTRHSIEQVDKIHHELYQKLFELGPKVTLVHFEPVGWQRDPALLAARREKNDAVFEYIGKGMSNSIETEADQIRNAAWWSWRLDYNMNLESIVRRYLKEDKISLAYRAYDFGGVANVLNPSTLIHLEFKK